MLETSAYDGRLAACHILGMPAMMPLYDLLESIKPDGVTFNQWASRAGVSRSFFADVRDGANPREDTLRKVVEAAGLTLAQFYEMRDGPAPLSSVTDLPFRGAGDVRDVPLLGTAQASDMEVQDDGSVVFVERMDLAASEVVDHLRRPSTLANRRDVYAISVIGSSAMPKFEDGDPVYVDPKRQPSIGDWVVVQLRRQDGDGEVLSIALMKELVRRTSSYIELHQLNPDVTFRVPLKDVRAVHRVIPWKEIVLH